MKSHELLLFVIPAKAGHFSEALRSSSVINGLWKAWTPAFAGVTTFYDFVIIANRSTWGNNQLITEDYAELYIILAYYVKVVVFPKPTTAYNGGNPCATTNVSRLWGTLAGDHRLLSK